MFGIKLRWFVVAYLLGFLAGIAEAEDEKFLPDDLTAIPVCEINPEQTDYGLGVWKLELWLVYKDRVTGGTYGMYPFEKKYKGMRKAFNDCVKFYLNVDKRKLMIKRASQGESYAKKR